jgi:uncharacterized protein YdhG (YjbR/CyaY superfamily)
MSDNKEHKTIIDYINAQPHKTKVVLEELRNIILDAAPDATELFNYGIPAFALVSAGKRDQQIMIAAYKNHVGLYPHPTVMEQFAEELKDFTKGKGSVQFPLNKPLPRELIFKMIKFRMNLLNIGYTDGNQFCKFSQSDFVSIC